MDDNEVSSIALIRCLFILFGLLCFCGSFTFINFSKCQESDKRKSKDSQKIEKLRSNYRSAKNNKNYEVLYEKIVYPFFEKKSLEGYKKVYYNFANNLLVPNISSHNQFYEMIMFPNKDYVDFLVAKGYTKNNDYSGFFISWEF